MKIPVVARETTPVVKERDFPDPPFYFVRQFGGRTIFRRVRTLQNGEITHLEVVNVTFDKFEDGPSIKRKTYKAQPGLSEKAEVRCLPDQDDRMIGEERFDQAVQSALRQMGVDIPAVRLEGATKIDTDEV